MTRYRPYDKAKYERRKASGLCTNCGTSPSRPNRVTCEHCKTRQVRQYAENQESSRVDEVCRYCRVNTETFLCTTNPLTRARDRKGINYYCEVCYFKLVSSRVLGTVGEWQGFKTKLEEQNYLCSYTGERLILGSNASVDHIYPKKRFPELAKDLDNIEWVTISVNMSKRDMTRDEFLSLMRSITKHLG